VVGVVSVTTCMLRLNATEWAVVTICRCVEVDRGVVRLPDVELVVETDHPCTALTCSRWSVTVPFTLIVAVSWRRPADGDGEGESEVRVDVRCP